ncbi:hypothetical protein KY318_00505 [Candidatus Woesearchaeota archaeon]|nr:hypothetical protein [Candidatus Woesearchaeota archaeon]
MKPTKPPLKVLLTFDTDMEFICIERVQTRVRREAWSNISQIKQSFLKLEPLRKFKDSFGNPAVFTWFVRADNEFEILFGDPLYLINALSDFLRQAVEKGDEIGWHPHIYKFLGGVWQQERDEELVCHYLREYWQLIQRLEFRVEASRMGWGYCTNRIMKTLNELGIGWDSSAIPGRVDCSGEFKNWEKTPLTPYHPYIRDYRVPPPNGSTQCYAITEVPITTFPIKAPYDEHPKHRYLNLSYDSRILKPFISKSVRKLEYVTFITHPYELMPSNQKHGLITHDISTAKENISWIISECQRLGRRLKFITINKVKL